MQTPNGKGQMRQLPHHLKLLLDWRQKRYNAQVNASYVAVFWNDEQIGREKTNSWEVGKRLTPCLVQTGLELPSSEGRYHLLRKFSPTFNYF